MYLKAWKGAMNAIEQHIPTAVLSHFTPLALVAIEPGAKRNYSRVATSSNIPGMFMRCRRFCFTVCGIVHRRERQEDARGCYQHRLPQWQDRLAQ